MSIPRGNDLPDQPPTPAGEMLIEEFLRPMGTTPQFWMNLQAATDLYEAARRRQKRRGLAPA